MDSQQREVPTAVLSKLYYLMLAFQIVAAIVSVLVVVGLLSPLLIEMKSGSFQRAKRRISRGTAYTTYSTYNLYMVYLSFVDLMYLLPLIVLECIEVYQNRDNIDLKVPRISQYISAPYSSANLWINAIIAYEVLVLLRASRHTQRIAQPSLTRVNLQGGGVILGFALIGVLSYYNATFFDMFLGAGVYVVNQIPLVFVIGASILVKWQGYLPPTQWSTPRERDERTHGSTPRDRAVRGLAIYFFRVILVFLVIWVPVVALSLLSASDSEDYATNRSHLFLVLMQCFTAIQPILTFCMILTKPDVKNYIKDLVTLTYIFGGSNTCCCRKDKTLPMGVNQDEGDRNPAASPNQRLGRRDNFSLLGYAFSDVDDDAEANANHGNAEQKEDGDMNQGNTKTIGESMVSISMVSSDFNDEAVHCKDMIGESIGVDAGIALNNERGIDSSVKDLDEEEVIEFMHTGDKRISCGPSLFQP